jgi:hypothetical protein
MMKIDKKREEKRRGEERRGEERRGEERRVHILIIVEAIVFENEPTIFPRSDSTSLFL